MPRLRGLVMAAAVATLAIGALGAPVAGALPRANLAIVQGIPGKVADICIDGKEIKSGLRYGGKAFKSLKAGSHALKIRARQAGTCTGTTLAAKTLSLAPGADLTIVATAHAPMRVVVFDNAGLGVLPSLVDVVSVAIRHAADVGPVSFKDASATPLAFAPAVDPPWVKGDEAAFASPVVLPRVGTVYVTFPDEIEPIAGPASLVLRTFSRHEWILIGTNAGNARIVTIVRQAAFL